MADGTVNAAMARLRVQLLAVTVAEPNVGVRSSSTVQVNSSVAVSSSSSVTVTVAVPEPAAVGAPETSRAPDMVTPSGSPSAE